METDRNRRVKIRFRCRLENGRECLAGDTTLELVLGSGELPPALEKGLIDMKPGEHRKILVPAAEVEAFPFPKGSHLAGEIETPPGIAYEFGPGNGGDVAESIPSARRRTTRKPLPAGADLCFEVEMLSLQGQSVT